MNFLESNAFAYLAFIPKGQLTVYWLLTPSAAYMCQLIGSALVQTMAFRLFSAKPLSKPMLGYYQLDP